jgi:uncharacterized membrane protein
VELAADKVLGVTVGSTTSAFLAVLAVHVTAALCAAATGLVAALSAKGGPRHVRLGRLYYRALIVVFVTALGLTALRPREDWYLALIGGIAVAGAGLGVRYRRAGRPGDTGHIVGMGASLAAMLTAFYVDNGPHLPLWDRLPAWAFWLIPGVVAVPAIARSLRQARRRPGPATAERRAL